LIELIRDAARRDPARVAVITDAAEVTYGTLAADAEAAAAGLAARGITRFGIVHQDASLVLALLAGSSLVGSEACVYAPLDDPRACRDTAERFDHDVIVSDEDGLAVDAEVITPADLLAARPTGPSEPSRERPLLVLTTGTTGEPRGVRHDWGRILRAVSGVTPAPEPRWLLAYGLHQFGGLQVLIRVAAAGATLVAPVPRRPRQGLDAMRRHHVTAASATPTFWRFLLAEMRADGGQVPDLRQITLGGEAVPEPLLAELERSFPEARVTQIYAANEFGPASSVRDRDIGLPASMLDAGDDVDVTFKIVDGELWVRSRVGMLGYWGEDPIDADEWRPTGDLVDLEGDRVLFRGRTTDVINVGGVKVHPLPVEERVASVPGVVLARVFGRPNKLTGAIVAVEVVAADDADPDQIADAIRDACAELPAAARPRSIRCVDEIATRGQKIARRAHA
jgi:acyl-CoA synthetase (AMP-forming)/AMP-acid ligase II